MSTDVREMVLHRPMQAGDEGYIFSTWMQWARERARWLRLLPDRTFWDARVGYRAHLEALVRRGRVLVAADPESPEFILGYGIAEDDVLHAVYVDVSFRRRGWGVGAGLARKLVPGLGEVETVVTIDRPAFDVFAKKWRLRFDPFAKPLAGSEFRAWAHGLRESVASMTSTKGTGT